MKRDLSIGNVINNWTVVDNGFYKNGKEQVKLICSCGKEETYQVRYVNRNTMSKSCRSCSQIERRNNDGNRVYNVGDVLMNLEILNVYSGGVVTYKVKCLNCGNIYHTGHSVLNKKKNNKGLSVCHKCFEYGMKSKKKHTMCTENISYSLYNMIERQARLRGIEFNLTPNYLEKIFDGKCYLSGQPIKLKTLKTTNGKLDEGNASLDRINSLKGYVEGNVMWCDKKINIMKNKLNNDEFLVLCETIVNYKKNNIEYSNF